MSPKLLLSLLVLLVGFPGLAQENRLMNDSCISRYFFKTYYNPSFSTLCLGSHTTNSGEIISCGQVRNAPSDGFITKINSQGIIEWELSIGGTGSQSVTSITQSIDNNILAYGVDNSNGVNGHFIIKVDMAGNIIWRKDYQLSGNFGLGSSTLKQDMDGSIYLVAYYLENNLSFNDRIVVLRYDVNGTLISSMIYKPPAITSVLLPNDFYIKENSLYITGYHSYQSVTQGLLMKVNKFTGNIDFTKTYSFNGNAANFFQVFPYENDLYLLGSDNLNETDTSLLVRVDTAGLVKASNYFWYPGNRGPGKATLDAGGSFIWSSYYRPGGPINLAITKINPASGLQWVKQYPQIPNIPRTEGIHWSLDSALLITGYGNGRMFFGKFTKVGEYGCTPLQLPGNLGIGLVLANNHSFTRSTLAFNTVVRSTINSSPLLQAIDSICSKEVSCDSLKLIAPAPICNLNDTLVLRLYKSSGCNFTPNFIYNSSHLILISYSDTVIKFKALIDGSIPVKTEMHTGCRILKDSVSFIVMPAPDSLNLGIDRELCAGNTILLNAGKGYVSYLWQDGSTDSTFTIIQPGLFYVTTTDACGGVFSDSVSITSAPPIPFDAGADRTKCNNDTLHLSAPPGFINYTWSNNYNISSTTMQNVVVNPMVDTAYYIKAEKTAGCFAYDTVRISVNHSPAINLGTDKSFCFGDSAVFNAGAGFVTYLWSSGQSSSQIVVKTSGQYSVISTTAEGCKSFDTVKVLNVFSLPIVRLDTTTGLCTGSNKVLNAGSFSSYQWNTGATSSTITVNAIGKYLVTVTDANGCMNSDSSMITTLYPLPSGFLPIDTTICSYGSLELKPTAFFNRYLWSTGVGTSSLIISQPGIYWLEVTDNNTCKGRDSITVNPKQCMAGFYAPTAFTPNGDRLNDVFQPLLFGKVKKYQFAIYNRWGQIVFQTTEQFKAWDGRVGGIIEQTSVFVWTCIYQFEGEEQKTKKGTVTLIR